MRLYYLLIIRMVIIDVVIVYKLGLLNNHEFNQGVF